MKITKEQWIDKLGCKTFKLEKCMKKKEREQENLNFQRDQKSFSKTLEGDQNREGKISENEKFVEFWGCIWEKKSTKYALDGGGEETAW